MTRRRILLFAAVLAAVILLIFIIHRLTRSAGEEKEAEADMAVHAGKIQAATLHSYVNAYGSVEPAPAAPGQVPADSEVASPVAGVVAHIDCVEGRRVAKGDVLFRLDSRVAEVAVEKAKRTLAYAEQNFERQKKLLPLEGTSVKSYQEAEQEFNTARSELAAAATDLELLMIRAPLVGTVVKINTEPGEAVELNTVLAVIIDLDRLVVAASVPRTEAQGLAAGQPASFGGSKGDGTVVYVGTTVDDRSGTVPVRVAVPPGSGVRPGQFLTVRITSGTHAGVLAVPEAAVIADAIGGDTGKIVLIEGDKAVRKPVKFGFRESGLVEVSGEGLKEGQAIVTEDAYAVPDGTKVHIIG